MGEERRDRVREENLRMIRMNGLMDVELIRRSAVQIRQDAKASLAQGLERLTRNPIFRLTFFYHTFTFNYNIIFLFLNLFFKDQI